MGIRHLRWALLASALALGPASAQQGFMGPVPTTQVTIALPTATQSRTTLIAGVAGKFTYITVLHLQATVTAAVVTWSYGTGTNCGTGTVVMDGPNTLVPQTAYWGTGVGALMIAPQGNDVCLTVATQAVSGSVGYMQF